MKKITLFLAAIIVSLSMFGQAARVPLFEMFTSATCPPCKAGNTAMEAELVKHPAAEYASLKYQQNFPGNGDPYNTQETKSRRTTPYAINGVPTLKSNGTVTGGMTASIYSAAKAAAPLYEINGQWHIDQATKKVTLVVNFKSLGTVTAPKLYVAITEKKTTKNVKTNGETAFFNVVKKMLPDQSGTTITASTTFTSLSFNYTFPGSYVLPPTPTGGAVLSTTSHSVEELTDLNVVAFVQGSDKTVYNACNLTVSATPLNVENADVIVNNITTYPNPATNNLNVSFTSEKQDNVSFSLTSVDGSIIQSFEQKVSVGNNVIEINTREVANGTYILSVIDSKGNASASPIVIVK